MIDLLGFVAAFFTTAAFVPQALKVYKTKKTEDLSLGLFSMLTFGVFLWFIYGLLIASMPVIVANIITLLLAGYILYEKLTEPRRKL